MANDCDTVTREEWDARKANAPAALLELAAVIEKSRDEYRRRDDERWAAEAEQLVARRKAFEDALAQTVGADLIGWLKAFRVDDATFAKPHRLALEHRAWFALFDLAPVGFHPIRVVLHYLPAGDQWQPPAKPFGIEKAAGTRWVATLAEAIHCAGVFESCPF